MSFLLGFVLLAGDTKAPPDPWWGVDKAWHLTVSHATSNWLYHHMSIPCPQAMGISVGIGLLKELVDWKVRKTFFSWKDLLWDTVGATSGCIQSP